MGAAESTPASPQKGIKVVEVGVTQSAPHRLSAAADEAAATIRSGRPMRLAFGGDEDASAPPAPSRAASVVESELLVALRDAESQISLLIQQNQELDAAWVAKLAEQQEHEQQVVEQLEEEWSAKMGEYMQRNAKLRVEAKQSTRQVAALEKDLGKAQVRIKELEQGLEDAALGSDEQIDRAIDEGVPVQSLGDGHGGFDLSSPRGSVTSPPPGVSPAPRPSSAGSPGAAPASGASGVPTEIDVDSLIQGGRDELEQEQRTSSGGGDGAAGGEASDEIAAALAAEQKVVAQQYTPQTPQQAAVSRPSNAPIVSPARLTLDIDDADDPEDSRPISEPPTLPVTQAPPKPGGCCIVS